MSKLISVIVPVYNVEKYVEQCVRSIMAQTYKNLEIILVDDGAKDGSGAICDRLAEEDKRILVIHKENGGVSSARNAGMDAAQGEWIAFVDGDDYIEPTMYEKLSEIMTEDIAFCYFQREYPDGEIDVYKDDSEEFLASPWNITPMICSGGVLNGQKIKMINCGSWRSLYKKEIIEKNEIRFSEKLKMGEDRLFIAEYLSYCEKATLVKEPLYHYRKERTGSACSVTSKSVALNYEHEKHKFEEKRRVIENNQRMTAEQKSILTLFIGHEYYSSFVRAQIKGNPNYKKDLKEFQEKEEVREILKTLTIRNLRKTGCSFKTMIRMKLYKWGFFGLAKRLEK